VIDYASFIESKSQVGTAAGFAPVWLPDFLFDFQRALVEWAIRKGRAALFEDCGLGKTPQQLVWAENVVRHTNRPVLILTPLAVGRQTVREAEKFGVQAAQCRDGTTPAAAKIVVANYERLHHFDPAAFAGVVCDESSVLKNFDGKTKSAVTEFLRVVPYRLLCTATAAPNDFDELGTSAEALGELGYQDMLTKFFKKETKKDYLGWGRTKHRLRAYAERDFWRWVTSWARAVRRPSDLGFPDDRFTLPELVTHEHAVKASRPAPGRLFEVTAASLQEQQEETRRTLPERCGKVADLVNGTGKPALVWCHLNDEGNELCRLIPDAVQVSGADADEAKEEKLLAFADGRVRVLVTKPKIAGFGMNFQHCAHVTFFPTHSYEQFYQAVRRCWRFGQSNPVAVDVVTTEGGAGVLANLKRKDEQAGRMFDNLVTLMNESLSIGRTPYGETPTEVPGWLA
jgi:hypothetical protein